MVQTHSAAKTWCCRALAVRVLIPEGFIARSYNSTADNAFIPFHLCSSLDTFSVKSDSIMFCEKAVELIRELHRINDGQLPAFNVCTELVLVISISVPVSIIAGLADRIDHTFTGNLIQTNQLLIQQAMNIIQTVFLNINFVPPFLHFNT